MKDNLQEDMDLADNLHEAALALAQALAAKKQRSFSGLPLSAAEVDALLTLLVARRAEQLKRDRASMRQWLATL